MADQFVVPQFLDVEAKIIGPITGRQFVILMAIVLLEFIIYSIFLNILVVLLLGLPVLVIGLVFAFARVNGQPFHFIALNMLQTLRRPSIRVWDKMLTETELKAGMVQKKEPPPPPPPMKRPLEGSKLSELSLVVNTGGVYEPEGDEDVLLSLQPKLPPKLPKEESK